MDNTSQNFLGFYILENILDICLLKIIFEDNDLIFNARCFEGAAVADCSLCQSLRMLHVTCIVERKREIE